MFQGIIYKVVCLNNDKVYIGQTTGKNISLRKRQHKYMSLKKDRRSCFQCALLDEGFENFKWEQIDTADSQQELDLKEKIYIKVFKSNNNEFGYNSTDGGIEYKVTDNVKKKLSKSKKKYYEIKENREMQSIRMIGNKNGKGNKGRVFSDETILKMSKAKKNKPSPKKGIKLSEETKMRMSIAHKNEKVIK